MHETGLFAGTIERRYTGQRPGTKSARGPATPNRWSTVGHMLANRWSTAGQSLVNLWLTAGQPLVNRWSTAGQPLVNRGFCSPNGLHRIRLFVRPETRPGRFSSIAWKLRRVVLFWANRPVGVLSCPSPPCPAAPPCAAQPRPAHGIIRVSDSTSQKLLMSEILVYVGRNGIE